MYGLKNILPQMAEQNRTEWPFTAVARLAVGVIVMAVALALVRIKARAVAVAVAVCIASRLVQGKVGRGAVALALLALLGLRSSAFAGCWG